MIHIYHPNKAVKGFAASFWYSPKDDAVFATIMKQSGWDSQNNNGIFKGSLNDPTKKVNIKLSYIEVGGILDCIERNREFSSFHDSDATPKTISFKPWLTNGDAPIQKGYSFSITVKDKQDTTVSNPFYIGLTYAEGRFIREFLIFTMHEFFGKELAKAKAYRQNREVVANEQPQASEAPEDTAERIAETPKAGDDLVGF